MCKVKLNKAPQGNIIVTLNRQRFLKQDTKEPTIKAKKKKKKDRKKERKKINGQLLKLRTSIYQKTPLRE